MTGGPLFDEIRTAVEAGLGALEAQMTAMRQAYAGRLKPGQRRYTRAVLDNLARRIVVWQAFVKPELVERLDAIAEQVRALQAHRRGCSSSRGRCAGSHGPHSEEER